MKKTFTLTKLVFSSADFEKSVLLVVYPLFVNMFLVDVDLWICDLLYTVSSKLKIFEKIFKIFFILFEIFTFYSPSFDEKEERKNRMRGVNGSPF